MRKLKISAMFFSCAIMFLSLAGCSSNSSSSVSSTENGGQAQVLRVGMVTDEGGIGDKSFNDSAYAGLSKVEKDLGISLQVLEPQKDSEFESYMDRVSKTSDLVFGIGYKLKNAVDIVSSQNPNVKYVLIDEEVQGDNVHNLRFKEEEGSFLAGVLAGLSTKTGKVGFIGGTDSFIVKKFESGFIAGVNSVNPEAGKLLQDGITSRYAGSFSDTARGYEIAKSLYSDGVDIIYHAAGGVGIGMFRAAQETGNYAIGVDQDQAISLPEYSDVILTSVVKNLEGGVYDVVKEMVDGKFTQGTTESGLKEDGVYLADTNGKVSQEVLDKVNEFKEKIISGEIVVPKTIEELKNFNS